MDEETLEAPVEETTDPPVEEAPSTEVESFTELDPNEAPEGEVTPEWLQERYKAMQADYTRKRQSEAEAARAHQEDIDFLEALRSDPDTQRAVFEQLQELLDSETEGEEEAPDPQAQRLEALEAAEQQRQSVALATALKTHIDQLASEAKLDLDENDFDEIFRSATAGEQINGDNTANAFKAWSDRRQTLHTKWQESYLKSKQATEQLPDGTAATESYDFNDEQERQKRMAAVLEAR